MSALGVTALAIAGVWLVVLTVLQLASIRQIAIVTVRLDREGAQSQPSDHGRPIGERIPESVVEVLDVDAGGVGYLLLLGANCEPCRELVSDLRVPSLPRPVTAIISGREELFAGMLELVPPTIKAVSDPTDEMANALDIWATPFVFEIEDGTIRGKAQPRGAAHLLSLIDGSPRSKEGPQLHIQEANSEPVSS